MIVLTLLALLGCTQDPNEGSLSENVGASFAPCSAAEIRYMASRHNVMTAFEPCGQNKFQYFSWSPKGTHLYFQLILTGYIMDADAENKATIPVPTSEPLGPAAWMSASRLALPVGPEGDEGDNRIALFDIDQKSVFYRDLPGLSEISDLQRKDKSTLYFLAKGPAGSTVHQLDLDDGAVKPAFGWLGGNVDTFSYTPKKDAVAIGVGNQVTLYTGSTGEQLGQWDHATRGVLRGDGEWMALEYEGDEISIFHQRAWDELSERARAREIQRVEQFEETLPEGYPTTIRPPTLSMVDMTTKKRFTLTGVLGYRFQWYEPRTSYASFMLWGFEGKQFKRNVVLGNFADRLNAMREGRNMMGIEPFHPPTLLKKKGDKAKTK